MGNKRMEYLDYVKGFGILLVVLGHVYAENNYIKIWLYSFHMPLFFIISGILIKHTNVKDRDIKNIIASKFKSLIIPYICFELLAIFVWMVQNEFTLSALKWNITDSMLMYCKAGATWFLPCLFITEVIYLIMIKNIKNDKINVFVSLIIFLIPLILKTNNHYLIVIFRCFIAYGFVTFGYYAYDLIINKEITFKYLIILFILNIVLSQSNGYVDLWGLTLNNPILYTINSIIGTLFIIYTFKKIKTNLNVLKYFGVNTIIIMGTQQVILDNISIHTGEQHYNYIIGTLVFIVTVLIEIPIIEIINRYMPFMIGKFKKIEKVQVMSD